MTFLKQRLEINDTVQIVFNYYNNIDVFNPNCEHLLQEDCHNVVPIINIGKLIIVYIENEAKNENLTYQRLLTDIKTKKVKYLKAVFVYEIKSGFNKLYTKNVEFKKVLRK